MRFEGADGNVCTSRVGKETLAGVVPACVFPFVKGLALSKHLAFSRMPNQFGGQVNAKGQGLRAECRLLTISGARFTICEYRSRTAVTTGVCTAGRGPTVRLMRNFRSQIICGWLGYWLGLELRRFV